MIHIDLGKGNKKPGLVIRKVVSKFKLEQPFDELLEKFDNDLSRLVLFALSFAVAFLPYLVVSEYKQVIRHGFEKKTKAVEKELAVVQVEIQGLMPFKQELDSYESQKAQVNQRLSVIHGLIESRGTPVVALNALGQGLPDSVWLETVTFEVGDKSVGKLAITGKALANEDISDFVDRLSQSTYLKNVRIASVEASSFQGQDAKNFNVDLEANSVLPASPIRDLGSKK